MYTYTKYEHACSNDKTITFHLQKNLFSLIFIWFQTCLYFEHIILDKIFSLVTPVLCCAYSICVQAYMLAGLSGGFLTFFISMSLLLGRFISSISRKQLSQQSPRYPHYLILFCSYLIILFTTSMVSTVCLMHMLM